MKDRLAEIIGNGAEAFALLAPEVRAALVAETGSRGAAQARAFWALPEAARVALVARHGSVPVECGDAAPVAPARGAVRVFDDFRAYPAPDGGTVLKPGGFAGRRTMQRADAFDRMRARGRGGVVSPAQVGMGRLYRTMVEDQEAGAVRCVSAEAMMLGGAGGGTREGFTDARLALSRRIDVLRARIGTGQALAVRRVRPSARGSRVGITDRALVDSVCLQDMDLSRVLAAHGWAVNRDTLDALGQALAAALERMMGPRRAGRVVVWQAGEAQRDEGA